MVAGEGPLEHDDYDEIEQEFNDALALSLSPRGPDVLYEIIADLSLPAGAFAVDVGCGQGSQSIELAQRFGLSVLGIDPLPRRIDVGAPSARGARTADGRACEVRVRYG